MQLVNNRTGALVEPVLVDGATGEKIAGPDFLFVPGPGADDGVRERLSERGHRPFAQGGRSMSAEILDRGAARELAPDSLRGILAVRPRFASTGASASRHSACWSPAGSPGTAGIGGRSAALSRPPTTPMSAAT